MSNVAVTGALGVFTLTGLEKYEGPQLFNKSAVLEVEGSSACQIMSGEFDVVGDAGKQKGQFTWTVKLLDPDLNNAVIRARTFANGVDKNGEALGRQTADLLVSINAFQPAQIAAGATQNGAMQPAEVIAGVVGKAGFCRFKHGSYDKDGMRIPTTEGDGFITGAQQEQLVKDKQHRVAKPRSLVAQPISGSAVVNPIGPGGPAATPPPMAFGGGGLGGAPAPTGFPALGVPTNGMPAAPTGFPRLGGG